MSRLRRADAVLRIADVFQTKLPMQSLATTTTSAMKNESTCGIAKGAEPYEITSPMINM